MALNKEHFKQFRKDLQSDNFTLSYSKLNAFLKSPRRLVEYHFQTYNPTPQMNIGTAVHELFLLGDLDLIEVLPPKAPKKPSQAQRNAKKPSQSTLDSIAFWDEWSNKRYLITQEGFQQSKEIVSNIERNQQAIELRDSAFKIEEKIKFDYNGWKITGKADIIGEQAQFVCDLKTTKSVDAWKFRRSIFDYNYHLQAALYCAAVGCDSFFWVVVDQNDCLVYECGENLLKLGISLFQKAIIKFNECLAFDRWEMGREFWNSGGIIDI